MHMIQIDHIESHCLVVLMEISVEEYNELVREQTYERERAEQRHQAEVIAERDREIERQWYREEN